MTADEFNAQIGSATRERPMLTSDFARELADPDRREPVGEPGTIRVKISPFVYSAWGFGVLMPKRKPSKREDCYSLA